MIHMGLRIHVLWLESYIGAQWTAVNPKLLQADSEIWSNCTDVIYM